MKKSPQKIIYLTLPESAPSARFRVFQYLDEMRNFNFDTTVRPIPKNTGERTRLIRSLRGYDVVFLQKRLLQWWWVKFIRFNARVLVYDFDDAVMYRDSHARRKRSLNRYLRFRHTLRNADMVIAGNAYLGRLAKPHAEDMAIIATGVDMKRYTPKEKDKAPITLGWIGSSPNLIYLERVIEAVNRLYADNPCFQLKIVCNAFIDGFACPVIKKEWREDEEVADLQSFDIGLLPMVDDHWTRGKCALKLLQYMSCGLPSVSSNTEFVRSIIQDGENGFLAESSEDWFGKLRLLLGDLGLRRTLGATARRSIEDKYDVPVVAAAYASAIGSALAKKSTSGHGRRGAQS